MNHLRAIKKSLRAEHSSLRAGFTYAGNGDRPADHTNPPSLLAL
jgi:hypothetical protein